MVKREVVVNEFPLANKVPPVGALYHLIVAPTEGVADRFTVPFPHLEPLMNELIVGVVAMDAITDVLVDVQLPSVAST